MSSFIAPVKEEVDLDILNEMEEENEEERLLSFDKHVSNEGEEDPLDLNRKSAAGLMEEDTKVISGLSLATTASKKEEFEAEMDKVITSVIEEAVYLFKMDPREYHPYYLSVLKYIKMGQESGYISRSSSKKIKLIWERFEVKIKNFIRRTKSVSFCGEESSYATYLKSGKVIVVNGKELLSNSNRNEEEIAKNFKNLEQLAKNLVGRRNKGMKTAGRPKEMRNDLEIRLEFFEHCKSVTFPGDCAKMNGIWKSFLNEFKEAEEKQLLEECSTSTIKISSVKSLSGSQKERPSGSEPPPTKLRGKLPKNNKLNTTQAKNGLKTIIRRRKSLKGLKSVKLACKSSRFLRRRLQFAKKFPGTNKLNGSIKNKLEMMICTRKLLKQKEQKQFKEKPLETKRKSATTASKVSPVASLQNSKIPEEDTDDGPTICEECGDPFENKIVLAKHKDKTHNPNASTSTSQRICPLCPRQFKCGAYLWLHFQRKHTLEGQSLKLYSFEDNEKDDQPQKLKHQLQPKKDLNDINCPHCGKMFLISHRYQLQRHILKMHGNESKSFQCSYCPKMFKAKDAMQAHERQLHLGENFECSICRKKHQGAGKLWKHYVDDHQQTDLPPPPGVTVLQCAYCGEKMLRGMLRHVEKLHPDKLEEQKEAAKLNAALKKKENKKIYEEKVKKRRLEARKIRKVEKSVKTSVTQVSQKCPHCPPDSTILFGGATLRKHLETFHRIRIQDKTKKWRCTKPGCRFSVEKRNKLELHIATTHFNLPWNLIKINAVNKTGLAKNNKEKWNCAFCHEIITDYNGINIHFILKHQPTLDKFKLCGGDRKFTVIYDQPVLNCLYCPEKFCSMDGLQQHVKEMHLDYCWNCPECKIKVSSPEELQEHFFLEHKTHTKAATEEETTPKLQVSKDFAKRKTTGQLECSECPENFSDLEQLTNHWTKDHGDKQEKLKCKLCGVAKFTENALLTHLLDVHRNEGYSKREVDPKLFFSIFHNWKISCSVCGTDLVVQSFKRHLSKVHKIKDTSWFHCPCPKAFRQRETWMTHMEEMHRGKGVELIKFVTKIDYVDEEAEKNLKNWIAANQKQKLKTKKQKKISRPKGKRGRARIKRKVASSEQDSDSASVSVSDSDLGYQKRCTTGIRRKGRPPKKLPRKNTEDNEDFVTKPGSLPLEHKIKPCHVVLTRLVLPYILDQS